jgi:hypothetical protein
MTEDEKVFMVLAFSWGTPYAYECYASHRVPVLNRSEYGDQNDLNRYAPYILPTLFLNATRMAKLFPISLAEHGFINDKMGIVSADEPPWRRSGKVLVDGIQARGGKVLDQVYVGTNLDGIASGISSAILRFRQRGIDRVVFWWEGGGAWLLFTRGADAQGWHPRYAISTYDAPKDVQELIPPEQLPGTVGAGFMTARDVSEQVQPPLTEREKACLKLLERRGAKASEDGGVRPDELDVCEMFLLAQQALQPVTGKTLVSSDVAGYIQALGAYPAVQFIGSQFARGRPDGIRKYANFKFIDSCSCFKYSSGWKDIPS